MWRLIMSIVEIFTGTTGESDFGLCAMERLCLEQAQLCALPESRAALEEMARNYRAEIDCSE